MFKLTVGQARCGHTPELLLHKRVTQIDNIILFSSEIIRASTPAPSKVRRARLRNSRTVSGARTSISRGNEAETTDRRTVSEFLVTRNKHS